MVTYKFFKYKDTWRYRAKAETDVRDVDTRALNVLGVLGGPKVVVHRKIENSPDHELVITVENGFITKAEIAEDFMNGLRFTEVNEFTITEF